LPYFLYPMARLHYLHFSPVLQSCYTVHIWNKWTWLQRINTTKIT